MPMNPEPRCTPRKAVFAALTTFAVLFACTLGACGKKGIAPEIQAFKDAGRNVGPFSDTDATSMQAKQCQLGSLDGVQAILCDYTSSDAAALGLQAAQGWLGEAPTGLVLQRDLIVLGLADRNGTDPSGKSITALSKIFRRTGRK